MRLLPLVGAYMLQETQGIWTYVIVAATTSPGWGGIILVVFIISRPARLEGRISDDVVLSRVVPFGKR